MARIAGVNIPTNKRVRDRADLHPRDRSDQGEEICEAAASRRRCGSTNSATTR